MQKKMARPVEALSEATLAKAKAAKQAKEMNEMKKAIDALKHETS
jgi:hypothetical protein